ncbi:hypothetical protein DL96DRAFT_1810637 [Flagelloscypha sp. PMI_526]|nr:hypothetical protein DL96DRAFT_1810637 [Flagelloscypha sp. PMI_526]
MAVHLDTLALELIQNIASFLSCKANIALSQTCIRLREACYTALVFHSIIENGNGTGKVPPWKWPTRNHQDHSTETWARLCLADSRCTIFEDKLELFSVGFLGADKLAYTWLPILLATNHPILGTLHLPNFSNYLAKLRTQWRKPNEGLQQSLNFSFCFSAALIHQVTALVEMELSSPLNKNEYIMSMKHTGYPCSIAGPFFLEILRCRKRMAFSNGSIADDGTWQPPPTLKTLPFSSAMLLETLVPFSNGPQFSLSHLPAMASKEFIEDDVWTGYYAYYATDGPAPTGLLRIDRPMLNISILVGTRKDSSDDGLLRVDGTGRDHIGPFQLSGTLAKATGKMDMVKQYIGRRSFPWDATMTPFGILGTWRRPLNAFSGGWIWLWKKSWGDRSLLNSVVPTS